MQRLMHLVKVRPTVTATYWLMHWVKRKPMPMPKD